MYWLGETGGQLGNKLFTFSAFISAAITNNKIVINPPFTEFSKCFPYFDSSPVPLFYRRNKLPRCFFYRYMSHFVLKGGNFIYWKILTKKWPVIRCRYEDDILITNNLSAGKKLQKGNICAEGFGYSGFDNPIHHRIIKQVFALRRNDQIFIDKIINKIRIIHQAEIIIGVHIRQGDFKTYWNGENYIPVEFYSFVMTKIKSYFTGKKIHFIVCSDEKRYCSEFPNCECTIQEELPHIDLYTLASCDLIIGNEISSYSRWASYFGEKPLLALGSMVHNNIFSNVGIYRDLSNFELFKMKNLKVRASTFYD